MVKGFKGFNKDLKCRDMQYEVGKTFEVPSAKACREGLHFCEEPFDVFNYYAPSDSRYAEVEALGDVDRDNDDSKVATTKLRIKAEIGLPGIIKAGIDLIMSRVKWDEKKETGEDYSAASNTGDYSAASNTGNRSAASVEGKESVAMAIGYESKAKGALGCWIVLAEWEDRGSEHGIKDVQCVRVDGEKIKADTWYKLENGEFIENES